MDQLREAIERASHLLPAQGPITVFIHHNTLHALEHLPFEKAVVQASELFGCRPYLSQQRYADELSAGRIQPPDIDVALMETLGDQAEQFVGFLGTRFSLRRAVLLHPYQSVLPNELDWVVAESRALDRFSPDLSPEQVQRMVSSAQRLVRTLLSSDQAADKPQNPLAELAGKRRSEKSAAWNGPGAKKLSRLMAHSECRFAEHRWTLDGLSHWSDSQWRSFTLHLLWGLCLDGVSQFPQSPDRHRPVRHRDFVYQQTGVDADQLVHEFLIRFCLVMLDQGLGRWQIPERNRGFFSAFSALYGGQSSWLCESWLRPLSLELHRIQTLGLSPLESIAESLQLLGIFDAEIEPFLTQTLLALRGFAGMIWQMEKRRDRIAHPLPMDSLIEFLAVRLILERLALQFLAAEHLGRHGPLCELRTDEPASQPVDPSSNALCEAFAIFQLAQGLGWHPEALWNLTAANWRALLTELRSFSETERLAVYHLAYERNYGQKLLDALSLHSQDVVAESTQKLAHHEIAFDVVACIDEREESLRRHLEEVSPDCRTWGAAGFFSVAMYYRSAESHQFVPLCPIVIEPQHYVQELVTLDQRRLGQRRSAVRRQLGAAMLAMHLRSRMLSTGALAAVLGALAGFPLVARVLFPRLTGIFRHRFDQWYTAPPQTVLQLEKPEPHRSTSNLSRSQDPSEIATPQTQPNQGSQSDMGYSLEEMSQVVERMLRDIGMTHDWSRLVILLGHGSSTMNNPHESAYDCGACGGGRGGPNARAFAQMANDLRVREILATRGLSIPSTTYFLGGFHNTCNDQVSLFDLARVPITHSLDVQTAQRAIQEACERNAHERCRRFESADLEFTAVAALRHVTTRSEDLSQVRPECGHATNAACFVGRRKWTRGLFMDRRIFLHSYDPTQDDPEGTLLARILAAVIPVCAGINLEYYFSHVDPDGYGCGTKLPHNIAALVGVMNGAASDLRPGLPWQMVEIHEPVRLMVVVETDPMVIQRILAANPGIDRLVRGRWIQLATIQPESGSIQRYNKDRFEPHRREADRLPKVKNSNAWYRGNRECLEFAQLEGLLRLAPSSEWNPA